MVERFRLSTLPSLVSPPVDSWRASGGFREEVGVGRPHALAFHTSIERSNVTDIPTEQLARLGDAVEDICSTYGSELAAHAFVACLSAMTGMNLELVQVVSEEEALRMHSEDEATNVVPILDGAIAKVTP